MFDDEFLKKLNGDGVASLYAIGQRFTIEDGRRRDKLGQDFAFYLKMYALAKAIIESNGFVYAVPRVDVADRSAAVGIIREFVGVFYSDVRVKVRVRDDERKLSEFMEQAQEIAGSLFCYRFSDDDIQIIQERINNLRELIAESQILEAGHKERLLKRLEALQCELHKRMTNVDKFWGLFSEAGVMLGKFGADAKPMVDRVREIMEVVGRAQARAEELPSGASLPMLKGGDTDAGVS